MQLHSWTLEPFAVAVPVTSRQSPDRSLVTLPSAWKVHFWLEPPLQSQVMTFVPSAAPFPFAPRHLPAIRSSRFDE